VSLKSRDSELDKGQKGVFGSAFKTAFIFEKLKNQPNTLALRSYFLPKLFSSSKKLKAVPPVLLAMEVGNIEKLFTRHLQKN